MKPAYLPIIETLILGNNFALATAQEKEDAEKIAEKIISRLKDSISFRAEMKQILIDNNEVAEFSE